MELIIQTCTPCNTIVINFTPEERKKYDLHPHDYEDRMDITRFVEFHYEDTSDYYYFIFTHTPHASIVFYGNGFCDVLDWPHCNADTPIYKKLSDILHTKSFIIKESINTGYMEQHYSGLHRLIKEKIEGLRIPNLASHDTHITL